MTRLLRPGQTVLNKMTSSASGQDEKADENGVEAAGLRSPDETGASGGREGSWDTVIGGEDSGGRWTGESDEFFPLFNQYQG